MLKKIFNLNTLRIVIELLALSLAILLVKNHKLQLWLGIFAVGVIISIFFGRLYCGWICPMNTLFRGINFIYRKLKISRLKTPKLLQNNVLRILLLVLFVASMVIIRILNLKINTLLFIILFSVLITLIFEEEFWHRRLCPFGTILSFTSQKARLKIEIQQENCIACGKCQQVCPSSSIITQTNGKRKNIAHECLLCNQCVNVCPTSVCKLTK